MEKETQEWLGYLLMLIGAFPFLLFFSSLWPCLSSKAGAGCLLLISPKILISSLLIGLFLFAIGFFMKEREKIGSKIMWYFFEFSIFTIAIYLSYAIEEALTNSKYLEIFRTAIIVSCFIILVFFLESKKFIIERQPKKKWNKQ